MNTSQAMNVLPVNTILNGKYKIISILGEGGFGITYLAWDLNMKVHSAIKEYFPSNLIYRDVSSRYGLNVYASSQTLADGFSDGLSRFVEEASLLARFYELPGIVSVREFFYENGTGYIVMDYIDGCSLSQYMQSNGNVIGYGKVLKIMEPVIRSLYILNKNKLLHRDISPDNIMIDRNENIKLIDFGAARYFGSEYDDKSRTIMLKEGYAPIEQYARKSTQGEWSDVYSLCATIYRMLTGIIPPNAPDRIVHDELIPIRKINKNIPQYVASAIEAGLKVRAEDRTQNMHELYVNLYQNVPGNSTNDKGGGAISTVNKVLVIILCVIIGIIITLFGILFFMAKKDGNTLLDELKYIAAGNSYTSEYGGKGYTDDYDEDEEDDDNGKESKNEKPSSGKDKKDKSDNADNDRIISNDDTYSAGYEDDTQDASQNVTPAPAPASEDTSYATGYNPITKQYSYSATEEEALEAVKITREGKIINHDSLELGQILDYYCDDAGSWMSYVDDNGVTYTYFEGKRGGEPFVLEFQVSGNSFTLTNATRDGQPVGSVSEFFKGILDAVGV